MATHAYAHSTEPSAPTEALTHWHLDPVLPAVLLLAFLLYALTCLPLRKQRRAVKRIAQRRTISFLLGLITLYITLASPLDRIGEQLLFSAHMLQHVLLIYPVSLLLLLGLPVWFLDPLLARPGIRSVVRGVTHPVLTCAAFTVVFAAWHIPGLYEWALRDRTMHDLEHLSMLGIGFLMWWPLHSAMPRFPPRVPRRANALFAGADDRANPGLCLPHVRTRDSLPNLCSSPAPHCPVSLRRSAAWRHHHEGGQHDRALRRPCGGVLALVSARKHTTR